MEVLIIGAGPIGCFAAQLLKNNGINPVLLEEHNSLGKPVHCAGIVSSEVLNIVKDYISRDVIRNEIDKFSINTPWEDSFSVNKDRIAVVLDREKFDISLGKDLDIRLGERVVSIIQDEGKYIVKTDKKHQYTTEIVIGADGFNSVVRKFLLKNYSKFNNSNSNEMNSYSGLQYRLILDDYHKSIESNEIKVFFDEKIPFFIWIVPDDKHSFRLGVLADNGKEVLNDFMKKSGINGKIVEIISGKVPIGFIPTYKDGIALVGDAACQTKPLTGGGLSYGLQSAQILADCIKKNNLEKYDEEWKRKFGQEIRFGLKARKIYENLNEFQRAEVFRLFKNNSKFIGRMVDFDHHSKLFIEAFKSPKIFLDTGKLLKIYLQELVRDNIS